MAKQLSEKLVKSNIDTITEKKSANITKTTSKKNEIVVKFKKNGQTGTPIYAHDGDVGMDVVATDVEYLVDIDAFVYHTGLYCESDKNIGCFLMPRSSNRKTEAYMPNSIGLVDTYQYRGEICFVFKNRTSIDVTAAIYALSYIDSQAWWKKPFLSFNKIWNDKVQEIINNPMIFAPYQVGEKIGQMVFFTHPTVNIEEVNSLSETERGEGGFGSTGK